MSLIGTLFTTLVGIIIIGSSFVDAAMAGFTLSFALDFSGNMLMAVRGYASLKLDMNAAELVVEYSEVETEDLGGEERPAAWPMSGRIEVKDLVASYANDLPPVLKKISLEISDRERVGIIECTGAGKSSLTLALFRFIETQSGKVFIDGKDTSKINLRSLRSRLAIIPQDPRALLRHHSKQSGSFQRAQRRDAARLPRSSAFNRLRIGKARGRVVVGGSHDRHLG